MYVGIGNDNTGLKCIVANAFMLVPSSCISNLTPRQKRKRGNVMKAESDKIISSSLVHYTNS